jgi:hypothetical protein
MRRSYAVASVLLLATRTAPFNPKYDEVGLHCCSTRFPLWAPLVRPVFMRSLFLYATSTWRSACFRSQWISRPRKPTPMRSQGVWCSLEAGESSRCGRRSVRRMATFWSVQEHTRLRGESV